MKSENLKVYLEELRLAIVIKPEDKDEEITIALGIKSDGSDAPVIALDEDGVRLNGFFYVSAKNNELQLAAKLTADETQNKYTLKKNAVGFISRGNEEELKRLVVPEGENIYNILYNTIN